MMKDRLRTAIIEAIVEAARPQIEKDMEDWLLWGDPADPRPSVYPALNKMLSHL